MSSALDPFGLLWKMVIRPPRAQYALSELGAPRFRLDGKTYERQDIRLPNGRGHFLECSHFQPIGTGLGEMRGRPKRLPCVVYLHGNCSSRLEALETLQHLLPRGITVFCLDFAGSGHSDGEFVSLGHFEEQDLAVVIKHIRDSGRASSVGLWGRSMGAATAVFRAAKDDSLAACVLDSPFGSLPTVARELVLHRYQLPVPQFIMNFALGSVRTEVLRRAGFDIEEVVPLRGAPSAKVPALFAVAKEDDFVLPHHTFDLHQEWGTKENQLVTVGGGHDTPRPSRFMSYAADFLQAKLKAAEADAVPALPRLLGRPTGRGPRWWPGACTTGKDHLEEEEN